MILRAHFPRTVFREGMARSGDHTPAGSREALHRGMGRCRGWRRSRQHHPAGCFGIRGVGHVHRSQEQTKATLSDFKARRIGESAQGSPSFTDIGACVPSRHHPCARKTTRSCRRNGLSIQNSRLWGRIRKPVQWGGRGTSPMAYFAAFFATRLLQREAALQRTRLLAGPGADCGCRGGREVTK